MVISHNHIYCYRYDIVSYNMTGGKKDICKLFLLLNLRLDNGVPFLHLHHISAKITLKLWFAECWTTRVKSQSPEVRQQ